MVFVSSSLKLNSATEGADSRPQSAAGTPTEENAGKMGNGRLCLLLQKCSFVICRSCFSSHCGRWQGNGWCQIVWFVPLFSREQSRIKDQGNGQRQRESQNVEICGEIEVFNLKMLLTDYSR
jgi:hypothetical protein